MPIFLLRPEPSLLREPAWDNSPYRGDLWVNAADEAEARGLASGRYENAAATVTGVRQGSSPWLDARLVRCSEEQAGPDGMAIPDGVVVGDRQM